MSKSFLPCGICAALLLLAAGALVPTPVDASHGWSKFHWQRTSSAIRNIPVRRFHSSIWLARFNTAMTDWRKSAMTKIKPVLGATGGPSNSCPPALNQITSCDGSYGNTGWLGLATIWYYTGSGHIAQGTSRVNNTYFTKAAYNTIPNRQLVICQEIGHNFGLGHVNVTYTTANVGSCMDYTNDPDGGAGGVSKTDPNNMHPNAHDYALINSRHNHVGSRLRGFDADHVEFRPEKLEMPSAVAAFNPTRLSDLGTLVAIGDGGRTAQYQKDFGNGFRAASFVVRAH
jgi:hypothetical protein